MNSTSSRTNALIDFRWYRKIDDKVRIQKFTFLDMAGSERVNKSGLDSGPTWGGGQLSLTAFINNFGLQ